MTHLASFPRAVGLDPGPSTTGYGILEMGRDRRGLGRFVACGQIRSSDEFELLAVLDRAGRGALVCVETPSASMRAGEDRKAILSIASELIATSRQAGWIAGYVAGLWQASDEPGPAPFTASAEQVRAAIGAGRSPSDAQVKAAVQRWVTDLPKISNAHERDALAVALVGLWNVSNAVQRRGNGAAEEGW